MARKSRTPPPPRRPVQAPQRRQDPRDEAARKKMLTWIAMISTGLFIAAAALTFFAFRDDGAGAGAGGEAAAALREAGCTVTEYPAQARTHVDELEENFKYNSEPPSSGPHSGEAPIFGIYTDPVDPLFYIHGLEHGGVAILYGEDVPQADVDALSAWYQDDPNGLIVGPREEVGAQTIALAAWTAESLEDEGTGVVAKCQRFDEDAFDAFIEEYGFKGPESDRGDGLGFTRDDLTPGGG